MQRILIVDSNDTVRESLSLQFEAAGLDVATADDFYVAQSLIKADPPSIILIDINEDNTESLTPLKKLRDDHPEIKVMAMTALGSVDTVVAAMRMGAVDFLLKPFSPQEILARAQQHLLTAGPLGQEGFSRRSNAAFDKVIGKSPAIQNIITLITGIANMDKTVLISGESGVGKSFMSSLVHETSRRSTKPLMSINCSAFTEEIFLDSELFGYARGAFEGASVPREGVLLKADSGTVILDEVGEIPLGTQAKLLRYLQSGEIRRVGENTPISTDARVIATTTNDLDASVDDGLFRSDLYFRLKNIAFEIPPLHKRGEDIPLLIKHFLKQLHYRGGPHYKVEKEALSVLCSLSYPGNVLELKHVLEQITSVSNQEQIDLDTLEKASIAREPEEKGALQKVAHAEKEIIEQIIRQHPRNLDAAAKELGVSRTTLWRRMKKYKMIAKDQGAGA